MEEFPEKYLNENHENLKRVLEKYFFGLEGKFVPKDLERLAVLSRKNAYRKGKWEYKSEEERCNLMKRLELSLAEKQPEEVEKFWKNNETEFLDYFGRSKREDGKRIFENIKYGILNEIIANKTLKKVPGFQFNLTTSEIDINNKIDTIGYCESRNLILAIQIKQDSKFSKQKVGPVQEIKEIEENNLEKKEFFKGCLLFKEEIKKERGSYFDMKNLWITMPFNMRVGEGGKSSYESQERVIKELENVIRTGL